MRIQKSKTVVVADDHVMFRQGLISMLDGDEFQVIGEAEDGHETIRLVRNLTPDLAILDFSMPLLNGIDAARDIQRRSPNTQVVLLTMYDDDACVLEALRAGVRGYVLKTQTTAELVVALREVLKGSVYLSPGISDSVVNIYVSKNNVDSEVLSERERQVLQLIAEGHTTKSIASMLFVSVKTAESHRTHIMQRLDIHNIASLVRYAIRRGMIKA
ncbi:MAG: response regulator transcription factor [Gammaproteobacteria bacterium]|nr:response regulator transcription factor [Gammaproteobacteria bacterium]MDP2347001.1 response regulator transcription factor [Gammaproteobacteria bacterium]